MDHIRPPKPLSLEGNVTENWKVWKQNFEFYLLAKESQDKAEEIKSGIFLHSVGEEARLLYNTLVFNAVADKLIYTKITEKFEAYITPRKNTTFCRYKFFTYRQEEGQNFDKYLTEMRKLSNDCELGGLKDSLLADMMIFGLRDKRIQESLLRKEDLTLIDVMENCKAAEITTAQATIMHKGGEESEMSISLIRNEKGRRFFPPKHPPQANQYKDKWNDKVENCKFCSYTHYRGSCPAYNKICSSCNKKGHFAKSCCKNKANKTVRQIKATNKKTEKPSASDSSDINNFFIGAFNELINLNDDWAIDLHLITN